MASVMEVYLGGLFENFQKATCIRTYLVEMFHSQPPTPVETKNSASNVIINGMKKIQSNRHEILLSQIQNMTKSFPQILGRGKEKPGGLRQKNYPIRHHRMTRTTYLKAKKKTQTTQKTGKPELGENVL